MNCSWSLPVCFCLLGGLVCAQEPVTVGKGSYAAFPPPGLVVDQQKNIDRVKEVEQRKLYLVEDDGRPIPSNKWFQNLLLQQYGTGLWSLPHKVDATKEGIEVFYPTQADSGGTRMIAEFPLIIGGRDFKPTDSRAKRWADWMVSFRMPESESRFMDVTLGEGMPYVWCEFKGVQPTIAFGGGGGKGSRGKNAASFFDLTGKAVTLPVTSDALGVSYEGRAYGVFGPDGTTFEMDADGIAVTTSGVKSFLVVCPLPNSNDIGTFHKHAFAVPRDTQLSWNYDRQAGSISTIWKVIADALKGTDKRVLQGWLPHHWRDNTSGLEFGDIKYQTIRGPMKCAIGNEFVLRQSFHGVLPNLPSPRIGKPKKTAFGSTSPAVVAGAAGASVAADSSLNERMPWYLSQHFADPKKTLGGDTYSGGKDLQRYAQAAFMAAQIDDASYEPIVAKLRSELENWLTYSPGEKQKFFAYYPRRKGLVGFSPSYGSEHFTDHHFHYGYFVFSAGLLSQLQPDFATQYGEMAKLIAKTYANYDRDEQRFPFLRTFDIWRGHSFADGNGFPDGNNQESTGEAINSWVGLILLGEALGDEDMTAAGVMGYSFETRANVEYWFDPHHDIFPPQYAHNACGMIWCNSIVWGTWFTASPAWIYGIQWLPSSPSLAFYDRERSFIKRTYADVVRELDAFETAEAAKKPGSVKKAADIKSLGGELGSYHLGFVMHADPQWVIEQIDALWSEPSDKVAHDQWMAGIYYQAHALAELGRVDWTAHGSSPTSMVYLNEKTKTRTLVAWNPSAKPQTVSFFEGDRLIGQLDVGPHRVAQK
ncbi:MAG: glycosyl hydrolase [Planctomycetales bacterium]|nr:glycosyl hydrolase [Planctomycetales bacterium]